MPTICVNSMCTKTEGKTCPTQKTLHFGLAQNCFKKYGLEIGHLGGLGGTGSPGNPPRRWGAKPPAFLESLQGPRGRPDPKSHRFPAPEKVEIPCQSAATSSISQLTFLKGLQGPRGRPDPKSHRFPAPEKVKIPCQSAAT